MDIQMKVQLDEGAIMPTRAHGTDAGLDLYTREDKVVPAHGYATFDTGVHIELPPNTYGKLESKSGLNFATLALKPCRKKKNDFVCILQTSQHGLSIRYTALRKLPCKKKPLT